LKSGARAGKADSQSLTICGKKQQGFQSTTFVNQIARILTSEPYHTQRMGGNHNAVQLRVCRAPISRNIVLLYPVDCRNGKAQWNKTQDVLSGRSHSGSGGNGKDLLESWPLIQVSAPMRIFVAIEAVDFRKGIDGLCRLCRDKMEEDPFSGALFVFRNRSRTSIKLLFYDGQGYWLCQKRLSQGRFTWWPHSAHEQVSPLAAYELQLLLWNGNPDKAQISPLWKRVSL
jgi:transposase